MICGFSSKCCSIDFFDEKYRILSRIDIIHKIYRTFALYLLFVQLNNPHELSTGQSGSHNHNYVHTLYSTPLLWHRCLFPPSISIPVCSIPTNWFLILSDLDVNAASLAWTWSILCNTPRRHGWPMIMLELWEGQEGLGKSTETCLEMTEVRRRLDRRVSEHLWWNATDV